MNIFFQATACVLISVILGLFFNKQGKDISALLGIATCCLVFVATVTFLKPVLEFAEKLQSFGNFDSDMLQIIFKAVGIGLISELATLICNDSGNTALGKAISILACAAVLWLSLPLMEGLISFIQKILGEV